MEVEKPQISIISTMTMMYKNPIIYGDYSDPDVIRVNADYYMVSSSFCNSPAIPILQSKDLINWKVINYVCKHIPGERYRDPVHGCGVWAPAIRYHKGEFYVFFPMPDEGIYVCKTTDPWGEWSQPVCVFQGRGYIDPCPFWDEDGSAYLVCGVAFSRYGQKSLLLLAPMAEDGLSLTGDLRCVYDGNNTENETIEGPKLYKRNGYYYIFAPAGGVKAGHQVVLRSREIYGPYEYRIVLKQGRSSVNGPHQGAWVDTDSDEHFFIHFQDVYAGGRIVHMQPMEWEDDWPIIGAPVPGETYGEPVSMYRKPQIHNVDPSEEGYAPECDDDFSGPLLGLQWQWNANYEQEWYSFGETGGLYLKAVYKEKDRPLCDVKNLLLQKWPAPEFICTTVMDFSNLKSGETAGIVSLGETYAGLEITRTNDGTYALKCISGIQDYSRESIKSSTLISYNHNTSVATQNEEDVPLDQSITKRACNILEFRTCVKITEYKDYMDRLDYMGREQWVRHVPQEEITLQVYSIGSEVPLASVSIPAKAGRWVGVKYGVFCYGETDAADSGYVVVKSVRNTQRCTPLTSL